MGFLLNIFTRRLTSIIIFFILLVYGTHPINAQQRGILRGFVSDSLSGEVLPYANIYIPEINRGTNTDFRGYFLMASLPFNRRLSVIVSYVGYNSRTVWITIEPYQVTDIRVELSSVNLQMKTIESVGFRYPKENATDVSLQRITMRELEKMPQGVETDIFRSLTNLTGVQSGGDVSSRYYVRGSNNNENLILLDNATIYNPYHAMGILSSIDPDIVSSLEFYKGGFPTEYSGRLSSVLKIVTKDGNQNSFGAKASISALTGKLMLEGPIPHGSFIVAGRKSYSNFILKKFRNDNTLPADFYDVFMKLNYSNDDVMKDAKFTVSFYSSSDKINNGNPLLADYNWSNSSIDFNYFQISDSPLFYQIDVSASDFKGEQTPNYSTAKNIFNQVSDVTMRMDFNYVYGNKNELDGGFRITEINNKLYVNNQREQTDNIGGHGTNISIYLKYKLLSLENLSAEFGTRLNATRLAAGGPAYSLEPRSSFTYRFSPEVLFKAAWGIYMQDLVTISDENSVSTVFEPWLITPSYLQPSTATHYISGFEFNPTNSLSFNLEGYYKLMKNLAIVNEQKYVSSDPDLIPGKGESYGVEFQTKYGMFPINVSVAYSLMWSFRDVNGVRYVPRFDSRNNLTLAMDYDFGGGWQASAQWSYSSGLPFTQIAGYYEKLQIDDVTSGNYILNSYIPFTILGGLNLGRLPDYHRLDLSVSKKIQIGKTRIYFDVSVLNVYNRKNLFYFTRDTGKRVDMLPFLPSATIKAEL